MYFMFNGKSSKDFDIKITKINNLSSPARKMSKVEVPFRGTLTIDEGVYEDHLIEIECKIITKDITQTSKRIKNWLLKGKTPQILIISNEPNKFYKAIYRNAINIDVMMKEVGSILLTFDCKPGNLISGEKITTILNKNTILFNEGNEISQPYIKITGSGNIDLIINDRKTTFKNVNSFIEIDSDAMECFKTEISGSLTSLNHEMYGDFPYLDIENNTITWSGNVTKIEIKPMWIEI